MNNLTEKQSVYVYVGSVEYFAENGILPQFADDDMKKIRNVRVRNEKKAGYGLLAFAMEKMSVDADAKDCFLSITGKPIHKSFNFSISHSQGVVALAVSRSCGVGIDIEPQKNEKRTEKLLKKMMCEGENAINSLVLWTKKEAVFKCEGKEKFFKPNKINTMNYSTKSIKFDFEKEEFVLSIAGKKEMDVVFFSAPGGDEIVFSEIC